MSSLEDVAPIGELRTRFGQDLVVSVRKMDALADIIRDKPEAMYAAGGNVWNRVVTKRWAEVSPHLLSDHFERQDPMLHIAIGQAVGEEAIRDILHVRAWRGARMRANLVMELLVLDVFKDEVHLGDITFCDPDKPIANVDRRYPLQTHRGLGLIGTLVNNIETYAREKAYRQITLTAGTADLVPLFQSHGFRVEDSLAGRMGMKFGMSIPMEHDVL